jgi:4-amino-4-deoxy-L-arabinose transferase-like glycosyltransferase
MGAVSPAPSPHRAPAVLFFAIVIAVYVLTLADIPLIKADEWWGTEASWTIWRTGRFALPGFAGQLNMAQRTFFQPPGFYLPNALVVGLLGVSSWSIRLLPTLCALLSFAVLYRLNRRLLETRVAGEHRDIALCGVAVVAFNPMTFAVAHHTRPETLVVLLACCVLWLLCDPLFAPEGVADQAAERFSARALLAGLLSGYAVFSHYWAYVLPGLVGLLLLHRRRPRLLVLYGAGALLGAAPIAIWIGAGYQDFIAETRWLRGDDLGTSPWEYLQRRVSQVSELFSTPQPQAVWLVEAVGGAILLLCRPSRERRLIVALLVLVHALLFVFPKQTRFYTVAFVYFWGLALPVALASQPRSLPLALGGGTRTLTVSRLRWLLCAALVASEVAGLAVFIHRDLRASYAQTLAPLVQAMDAADPPRTGAVVGACIYYVALHERPYLPRDNPSLWRVPEPPPADLDATARAILDAWRTRGVRFVLLSRLIPAGQPLSPTLPAGLDARLTAHIRSSGRLLATQPTYFYGEVEQKYRWTEIELYELDPSRD